MGSCFFFGNDLRQSLRPTVCPIALSQHDCGFLRVVNNVGIFAEFNVGNFRFPFFSLEDKSLAVHVFGSATSEAAELRWIFKRQAFCATMKNILYFDLETQRSADEVGGWANIRDMRMSIGVTFSTARNEYRVYGEKQVDDLLKDLQRADLVVGFNNLRFDYEVLHYYTVYDLRQIPTLDVLVELQKRLTHRLSLDAVAAATFGVEKTAEGMQAIRWFREGRFLDIAEYCCYDVKITRMIHEYGAAHRQLFYKDRFGQKLTVPVAW
jgi:DEAD/DEAH box helicase domain-containing protein